MSSLLVERFAGPGGPVTRFTLRSRAGVEAEILDHGATLAALRAPDRRGRPGDVVLGFADPRRYRGPHPHLGGVIGRVANRIAEGRLALGDRTHALVLNAGRHHLHGGRTGFDRADWRAEPFEAPGARGVRLRHTSPDGDQGYPGRLAVEALYTLDDAGRLRLDLAARAERATVVNLTSHVYWNLRDGGASPALDHELELAAGRYAPVDADGIPTGELASVADTPFDFRTPRRLDERSAAVREPRGGYDHPFALDAGDAPDTGTGELPRAARLRDPRSGRALEIHTRQPALQLYAGQGLGRDLTLRGGAVCGPGHGICLEPQGFPDAPNRPRFPGIALAPGERYARTIVFALSVAAA